MFAVSVYEVCSSLKMVTSFGQNV